MGHEKAIESGQEHRECYRGARSFDVSCRNHGGCPYCEGSRTFKNRRRAPYQTPYLEDQYEYYDYEDDYWERYDDEDQKLFYGWTDYERLEEYNRGDYDRV